MKKFMHWIEIIAILILIILTGIVFLQVILRNFFETGFVWVEELSRFLLLSMVLISAPVVFFHGEHVKFDLLSRKLSLKARKIHSLILVLLVVFFYGVYVISHYQLMKNSGNVLSPSLRIPNSLFFSSGLIGAVLAVIAGVSRVIAILRSEKS